MVFLLDKVELTLDWPLGPQVVKHTLDDSYEEGLVHLNFSLESRCLWVITGESGKELVGIVNDLVCTLPIRLESCHSVIE